MKDERLDRLIADRFGEVHRQAAAGELFSWRSSPQGRLAEIIVLDQFSRNIFRGDARSFACDSEALVLAQEAIAQGHDLQLNLQEKSFLYMPFMHSESLLIHDQAVKLFTQKGLEYNLDFEFRHKRIIERFGRYPHRNAILGRISSPEEVEFLSGPDSGF